MKQPDNDTADRLDPDVERSLDAIDKALAGETVEAEFADLAALAKEVSAERPESRDEWKLEMDLKAGERFGASRFGSLRRLLSGGGLRRRGALLGPAGAVATAMVVVVVGVGIGISQSGGTNDAATEDRGFSGGAPLSDLGGDTTATDSASGEPVPSTSAAAEAEIAPEDGSVAYDRGLSSGGSDVRLGADGGARVAPGKRRRIQDRNASLALRTETEDVRRVSDEAIQITEAAGGVVISSELREREMEATARMQLQIPTRELDSTLDQLTDLATVESLNEIAEDITRPFISAEDRLEDARAERTELLKALGNASTDDEVDAIRGQLKDVRREISRAEASFENIARRARNSGVSLEVNGSPGGGDDGSWGLGDAADDALSALKTVAGVMLIAAAILAPLAILIAIVALITRGVRNTRRERALDE